MANELNLTGAQRAAIFLLGVGEEAATEVMRHMSAKEVQQVGEAMATISKLTNSQVESVLADFHLESAEINPLGLDAPDFTRRVMTSALGQDKAQNILSQVLDKPEGQNGVEALQWMAESDCRSLGRGTPSDSGHRHDPTLRRASGEGPGTAV